MRIKHKMDCEMTHEMEIAHYSVWEKMLKKTRTLKDDVVQVIGVQKAMREKLDRFEKLAGKTLPRTKKTNCYGRDFHIADIALDSTIAGMIALYKEAIKEANEYREKYNVWDSKTIKVFDFDTVLYND